MGPGRSATADGDQGDRRLARGSATRSSIVRATVELIDTGIGRPSVRQVASEAGVSRRLVFHYFHHIDALLVRAVDSKLALQHTLITPLPPRWPVGIRVQAVCRQRRELFEVLGPVYRTANLLPNGSVAHRPSLPSHLADLRRQLAVTFAPELAHHGRNWPLVLTWIDLATSWESWHRLRTRDGLSAPAAERTTVSLVTRVLVWP